MRPGAAAEPCPSRTGVGPRASRTSAEGASASRAYRWPRRHGAGDAGDASGVARACVSRERLPMRRPCRLTESRRRDLGPTPVPDFGPSVEGDPPAHFRVARLDAAEGKQRGWGSDTAGRGLSTAPVDHAGSAGARARSRSPVRCRHPPTRSRGHGTRRRRLPRASGTEGAPSVPPCVERRARTAEGAAAVDRHASCGRGFEVTNLCIRRGEGSDPRTPRW